jgi:hypothetical protein
MRQDGVAAEPASLRLRVLLERLGAWHLQNKAISVKSSTTLLVFSPVFRVAVTVT